MNQGYLTEYKLIPLLEGLGITVSIPCNPHCSYDLIGDYNGSLYKIQVKSCNCKRRNRYKVDVAWGANSNKKAYSKNSFDFLITYIVDEDSWYIIPLPIIMGQKWISVYPHNKGGKYEIYRNNWSLLLGG